MEYAKKMILVPQSQLNDISYLNSLDQEMHKILLDKNLPLDVKVKEYDQALKRYLGFRETEINEPIKIEVKEEEKPLGLSDVVEAMPKTYKSRAKTLTDHIDRDPSISWNEKKELVYKGELVSGSNMVDLINIAVKPHKEGKRTIGEAIFSNALSAGNVPKSAIGNKQFFVSNQPLWKTY